MKNSAESKYARLLAECPKFHAQFGENSAIVVKAVNHSLSQGVLDWFFHNVKPGSKTLETGSGYSSVVFSIVHANHIAISPFAEEHDAIKQWCAASGIATDETRFIAKPSQEVLPNLKDQDFDLVLIDGDHAFPAPFIDWYYTADRLKEGGRMIVDDTHLVTGTILREFLRMERGRWELEVEIDKTSIFRRVTSGSAVQVEWFGLQPFCAKRNRGLAQRIRRKLAKTIAHPDDAIFWA
jgi:hypothetical protein